MSVLGAARDFRFHDAGGVVAVGGFQLSYLVLWVLITLSLISFTSHPGLNQQRRTVM